MKQNDLNSHEAYITLYYTPSHTSRGEIKKMAFYKDKFVAMVFFTEAALAQFEELAKQHRSKAATLHYIIDWFYDKNFNLEFIPQHEKKE